MELDTFPTFQNPLEVGHTYTSAVENDKGLPESICAYAVGVLRFKTHERAAATRSRGVLWGGVPTG